MKRLHLAAILGLLFAAPVVAQSGDGNPAPSFIQVSIHTAPLGWAIVQEVAIARLPADPRAKVTVDGDGVTFTHYCDGR